MPRQGVNKMPEYAIWATMIQRCENPNCRQFKDYGGRGIAVCKAWRESFRAFLNDMGMRPTPTHSLDRINNGGNYEPSNCRWATRQEQNSNKRSAVLLTVNDQTKSMTEWAREMDIVESVIHKRLKRGWDVCRAVMTPAKRSFAQGRAFSSVARKTSTSTSLSELEQSS